MTPNEKLLLNNALDALDRLNDGDSYVVEVWALFFATSEALRGTSHYLEFEKPTCELRTLLRSGPPNEDKRYKALDITDDLRHYLAGLPLD